MMGKASGQPPTPGSVEAPRQMVERLLRNGELSQEQFTMIERLWHEELRHGVTRPNDEIVRIELDDLYHVMADQRLRRKPDRVCHLLHAVFEIRQAP